MLLLSRSSGPGGQAAPSGRPDAQRPNRGLARQRATGGGPSPSSVIPSFICCIRPHRPGPGCPGQGQPGAVPRPSPVGGRAQARRVAQGRQRPGGYLLLLRFIRINKTFNSVVIHKTDVVIINSPSFYTGPE